MYRITALGALVALLAFTASASAHQPRHHHHLSPGLICTDNSTTLQVPDVRAALDRFPDATAGACIIDTPPVLPTPAAVEQVVVADTPGTTFLCISHYAGTIPSAVAFTDASVWLAEGDFVPMAKPGGTHGDGNTVLDTPTGPYTLFCQGLTAKGTGTGVGDGANYDATAWTNVLDTYGPKHLNHYEIAG